MVELRPYRESDRAAFVALVTDEHVMRHMDGALTPVRAGTRFDGFLETRGDALPFARAAEESGAYVGHAFLVARADLDEVELGFIVVPQATGRGLGTAVARALVHAGFETLGLSRIVATVDEGNVASIRVLQKSGFADRGTRRDASGPYRWFVRERVVSQGRP